jgi:DNA-binding NarL/FixJ family response regulator
VSKQVVPYFEKGEHPLMVAKKLGLNKNTVRSYWHRWRRDLGI